MGKRVDLSARTVITSDPNIALNEVGIPLIIAKNLTYPEIVTKYNIQYLRQLVKNGQRIYPGANFVIKNIIDDEGNEAKHVYHLKFAGRPVPLHPGDIVERHLIDGDMVLFNRQPSLHKLSMMGHRCQIINDPSLLTFRVNVSVTEPYNADWYRSTIHHGSKSATGSCFNGCWNAIRGKQWKSNSSFLRYVLLNWVYNYLVRCYYFN